VEERARSLVIVHTLANVCIIYRLPTHDMRLRPHAMPSVYSVFALRSNAIDISVDARHSGVCRLTSRREGANQIFSLVQAQNVQVRFLVIFFTKYRLDKKTNSVFTAMRNLISLKNDGH
jgi:hypothetical protein